MSSPGSISKLQFLETRSFTGLTEENHLHSHYLAEPEKVGSIMAYAFGLNQNNILTLLTGGIGNTMEIGNAEYQWDLYSRNDRSIEVVDGFPLDGAGTPGLNGTTFRVKLREKWFASTDNIVSDNGTICRVQEEPYQHGNGYVYTLQLTDGDPSRFLDASQLVTGARWSKDFSTVEEGSIKGGSVMYNTPFKLHNVLSTLRKDFQVTRSAAQTALIIDMFDPNDPSKKTRMWTKLAEWTAMGEFYTEMEKHMLYSLYNKNQNGMVILPGENKRPVFTGAGLREQISDSNKRYYTELTYDILDQFLLDLSYAANRWGGDYKFVALTGKMGMREFHRAILDKAKGLGFLVVNEGRFISGSGQELVFEGQFITVKFLNGIELTVKEFPIYDDLERNRTLHPKSKRPIESYRFTILNVGKKEGKSNIRKVTRKGGSDLVMWHTAGSIDPMGGVAKSLSTMRSTPFDGYSGHMVSEFGLMLEDPLSCGELIMTID